MIKLIDNIQINQYLPVDAKICNWYVSGNKIIIETEAQYLTRTNGIGIPGVIITLLIPKIGVTIDPLGYDLSTFSTTINSDFDRKYYRFTSNLTALEEVTLMSDNNFTDAYKEKLDSLSINVYEVLLVASGTVSGKITGATVPSGWVLLATGDSGTDLLITHNLNRECADVIVWEKGTPDRKASPFLLAYSGITSTKNVITIEGLDINNVALRLEIIFK